MKKILLILLFLTSFGCDKNSISPQISLENSRYLLQSLTVDKLPTFKIPQPNRDIKASIDAFYGFRSLTFQANGILEVNDGTSDKGTYLLLNNGTLLTIVVNKVTLEFKVIKITNEILTLSYEANNNNYTPSIFEIIYNFKKG